MGRRVPLQRVVTDPRRWLIMRYLVVLDHTLGGTGLSWSLSEHALEAAGLATDIHVLVPAAGDEAEAAANRLQAEFDSLAAVGIRASGVVSAADPIDAIRGAMADQQYDGILIATRSLGLSRWLHLDLPHKVEREFQVPVEWIEADTDDASEKTTVHIELPRNALRNMTDPSSGREAP
jgi:hypothetical protein